MRLQFIDPGRLRAELRLEKAVTHKDSAGGHIETWEEIALLFGQIEPISTSSYFGAGQDHESVTHNVIIRFRPDVRSGMRFMVSDRVLAIVTVRDLDERGRYLFCRVREQEI